MCLYAKSVGFRHAFLLIAPGAQGKRHGAAVTNPFTAERANPSPLPRNPSGALPMYLASRFHPILPKIPPRNPSEAAAMYLATMIELKSLGFYYIYTVLTKPSNMDESLKYTYEQPVTRVIEIRQAGMVCGSGEVPDMGHGWDLTF
jgi:hypothetical protein